MTKSNDLQEGGLSEADVNPYAAPKFPEASDRIHGSDSDDVVDFRKIVKRWEFLRLFYNLGLATVSIVATLMIRPEAVLIPDFIACVLLGGVIANVAYFAGPLVQGYVSTLRLWHPQFEMLIFVGGTGLNSLLAVGCILVYEM